MTDTILAFLAVGSKMIYQPSAVCATEQLRGRSDTSSLRL
jgi:hypothetical protein